MVKYPNEVAAVAKLRKAFQAMPQRTLARRIVNRNFTAHRNRCHAAQLIGCTYASVYAYIRRHDWRRNQSLAFLALAA